MIARLLIVLLLIPSLASAAAVTSLGNSFNTTSGTHTVTATPAVNDLIVIITANTGSVAATAPTDNNSSGTYVSAGACQKATNADRMEVWVRTALVGSATSTIFTAAPGTTTGGGLQVYSVSGMSASGASAVRQFAKQDNQAAATPAPAFTLNALTGSSIIGAVFNATNPATMTPRSSPSYTESTDVGYATPTTGFEAAFLNSGETAKTITWGGASASAFCSLVLELTQTTDKARLFPGGAATDNVSSVATLAPNAQSTFGFWLKIHAVDATTRSILDNLSTPAVQATTGLLQWTVGFSTTNGVWTTPAPSLISWHEILFVYDGTNVANTPTVYYDGTSQTVTTVTSPVGTYSSSARVMAVGNDRGSHVTALNGAVAGSFIMNSLLNSTNASSLAGLAAPCTIATPLIYFPLDNGDSPEPDIGSTATTGTVTGTSIIPGPGVINPRCTAAAAAFPVNKVRKLDTMMMEF